MNGQVVPAHRAAKLGKGEAGDLHVRLGLKLGQVEAQSGPLAHLGQGPGREPLRRGQRAIGNGVGVAPDGPVRPLAIHVELHHHRLGRILGVELHGHREITLTRKLKRLLQFRENILGQARVSPLNKSLAG